MTCRKKPFIWPSRSSTNYWCWLLLFHILFLWWSQLSAFGDTYDLHWYFMLHEVASRSSFSELILPSEYINLREQRHLLAPPFCLNWVIFPVLSLHWTYFCSYSLITLEAIFILYKRPDICRLSFSWELHFSCQWHCLHFQRHFIRHKRETEKLGGYHKAHQGNLGLVWLFHWLPGPHIVPSYNEGDEHIVIKQREQCPSHPPCPAAPIPHIHTTLERRGKPHACQKVEKEAMTQNWRISAGLSGMSKSDSIVFSTFYLQKNLLQPKSSCLIRLSITDLLSSLVLL